MILDLYGVPFHAMVVFGHDREFLFNPAWAYCGVYHKIYLVFIYYIQVQSVLPQNSKYINTKPDRKKSNMTQSKIQVQSKRYQGHVIEIS